MATVNTQTNGSSNESSTRQVSMTSAMTTGSRQVNVQRVNVLREVVNKVTASYKRDLDSSSVQVLESANSADDVFDYIAGERLRCMPHSGSKHDKCLRWAESFVGHVSALAHGVGDAVSCSMEAAQLIYGSCLLVLQLGEKHLALLELLFGHFYKMGYGLEIFAQHGELLFQSPAAQKNTGKAFASLLQIVTNSCMFYSKKSRAGSVRIKSGEFERLFGRVEESFFHERSLASTAMWSVAIEELSAHEREFDIGTVRRYLAPQDRVTQALMSGRVSSRHHRAEFTCEWASRGLTDYVRGRDKVALISGKAFSGKSVLAGWISDRLRNMKGRLGHDVISYDLDGSLKEQLSPLSVIQDLVLQVFDRCVGAQGLYRAICAAVRASTEGKSALELEDTLWTAFEAGLAHCGKLMIIVDGIDQLGKQGAHAFLERLHASVSKYSTIRAIALTRPLTKAAPKGTRLWTVEPTDTREDIINYSYERLSASTVLQSLSHDQKHTITEKIAAAANGSFTWAHIAIEVLQHEKSFHNVTKALDSLPKDLTTVLDRLIATVDMSSKDTRFILAWMLAAQRPLLLAEIKCLFETDFTSMTYSERFSDIEQDVRRACGGLVDITDGVVRFASLSLRYRLEERARGVKDFSNNQEKNAFPFHAQEAAYDLCLRTLAYAKLVLERQLHVSVVFLTYEQLTEIFDEHAFLEYSSRFWLRHFQASPMHKYPEEHKLTSGFKATMPSSISHALIEGSCLRAQYPIKEARDLSLLSLTLRKTVLGDSNEATLQNLINVATIQQHFKHRETNIYFYQAFSRSKTLLGEDSEITISCAERYLVSITTFTKSTETEHILTFIIEVQKKTYGASHDTTIRTLKRAAEYYLIIKDTTRAATLYKEIYEILVTRYGYHHSETETILTQFKKVASTTEIQEITRQEHTSAVKNVDVSDTKRQSSTRDMIQQYEKENNVEKAEETMVNYWRDISEASRTSKDVKVQEKQVDATFEYVRFLQRHKRTEEATTILNGLFVELDNNSSNTESKVTWLQQVGDELKSMGANSSARNVFSSLWTYYRSSGRQSTKEAQSVTHSLIETASSSVTKEETTVESQEQILREILETISMTSKTVDITTIRTTQQLLSIYSRQEKHEEIIEICNDILQRLWPTVLTGQKDVKMPSTFLTEAVEFANQLTKAYFSLHYVEESTQISLSIFQGYRSAPKQYTKELLAAAQKLIAHYQNIYRHKDAIYIYEALYEALLSVYGPTHHQVIDILYEKAELELKQNRRREAQNTYEKIYTILKDKSEYCHKDGIRAALSLCQMYEKEQKWEQARDVYHILWETFLKKGQEYSLGVEFVNKIFDRYLYIIENKERVDHKTIRGLVAQYRDTCIKFYGANAEQTLNASLRLASLDAQDDQFKDEAITIYEFILNTFNVKGTSTASTFTAVSTSKKELAKLYSARGLYHDRAQTLFEEELESTRQTHGYIHKDALYWLRLLVTCYKKRNTAESNKAASELLQKVSIDILMTERDTQKLHHASTTLAQIWTAQEIKSPTAQDFLTELRRHIITGESTIPEMKGKTADRRSYTFIVGFEEVITHGQFSVIMSELMSEVLLTQALLKAKDANTSFDSVFGCGVRLRAFLRSKHRKDVNRVEDDLLQVFTKHIVGQRQVEQSAVRQMYDIVLAEHGKDQQDSSVLKTTSEAVLRACNESQFQRAYSLAVLTDTYMQHYDSFRSQIKIQTALKICLYLIGQDGARKCNDAKLAQQMNQLSRTMLKEILQSARLIHLHLISLPIEQLNSLVGLLGSQQNYEDMEWLLNDLWTSRHTQSHWPASTVVAIGRKLVECRMSMGDRAGGLTLIEDICYNLRRVWGPLDKTTLEMTVLMAELYGAVGDHAKAINVHEEILNQIISDELDMDQVSSAEEAEIVVKHLELLRRAFARNNAKFPAGKDVGYFKELYSLLGEQVGEEEAWKSAAGHGLTDDPSNWATWSKSFKDDRVGIWKGVNASGEGGAERTWQFLSEGDQKRKHVNTLRRSMGRMSSGDGSGSMNGGNGGRNGHSFEQHFTVTANGSRG